jgi:hypothetical protein
MRLGGRVFVSDWAATYAGRGAYFTMSGTREGPRRRAHNPREAVVRDWESEVPSGRRLLADV